MNCQGVVPACLGPDRSILAAQGLGDWGELIVFAVVVVMSALNGIIQAAKKKREVREEKRKIPLPKSFAKPPAAKRRGVRSQPVQRPTAQARRPILLPQKPQPRRAGPVSKSPPTAHVPPIFETLTEAIREANREKKRRAGRSKRRDASHEQARPVAGVPKPPKHVHQSLAERHAIRDQEARRESSSQERVGHVGQGVVAPLRDPYTKEIRGPHLLYGVDLRRAIVLKEILASPLALRETDDYFSP